jgi:hypothetical protein
VDNEASVDCGTGDGRASGCAAGDSETRTATGASGWMSDFWGVGTGVLPVGIGGGVDTAGEPGSGVVMG